MKSFIVLSALIALTSVNGNMYYTTENDYLDIDSVMKNPSEVNTYVNCFVDRSSCDSVMQSYKKHIPDAVPTACQKCNNAQKHLFNRFLQGLKSNYPSLYSSFQQKYDPNSMHMASLENAVAGY